MRVALLLLQLFLVPAATAWNPPPFPPTYLMRTLTQPVDHFDAYAHETFQHRYLLNDTFWGGPGPHPCPIFFYTGAEGSGIQDIWSHSGWIVQLAAQFRALIVFGEMRYFGQSFPFGINNSFILRGDRIGRLSIEQTLADYAQLIAYIKQQYSCPDCPVISFGGSLAGTLTTFMRVKYPHLVNMGLAASAPILAYPGMVSQYAWNEVVTRTFAKADPACPDLVRQGFSSLLDPGLLPSQLTRAFNTCTPATLTTASYISEKVSSSMQGSSESAYPPCLNPIPPACERMMAAASRSDSSERGLDILMAYLNMPEGTCLEIPQEPYQRPPRSSAARSNYDQAWDYLACTQVTHPIGANNVTDMFPPYEWDVEKVTAWCNTIFGIPAGAKRNVTTRPHWLPLEMGMSIDQETLYSGFRRSASRIIFSNGLLDPWSSGSVLHNLSNTLVAINIEDGSHHSDLGSAKNPVPSSNDSVALVEARHREVELLRAWLHDVHRERQRNAVDVL